MRHGWWGGLMLGVLAVSPALGQHRNTVNNSYGVGLNYYQGGRFPEGGVGIVPLYYPGFYGSGYSMYGPPVPTYGPVAGTFGAARYRLDDPVFIGVSLGYAGNRSPSPRPVPNFNPRPVVTPPDAPRASDPQPTFVTLVVRLPREDARLSIEGQPTRMSGTVREFTSPALTGEGSFAYDLEASWTERGQTVTRTRRVGVRPGDRLEVEFE